MAGNKELFRKWIYVEYFSLVRNGAWGCFEEKKKYLDHYFIKLLIFWLTPATLDIFLKELPCNLFSTSNFLFEFVQNQNSLAIISLIFSNDFMLISSYAWTIIMVKPFTMRSVVEPCSNNIA